MRKRLLLLSLLAVTISPLSAQDDARPKTTFADLTLGVGSGFTTAAASYQYQWMFGKKKKLLMGVGARFNGFFAMDAYLVTAPAKIVKGETGPGALFKNSITANMDTVFLPKAQTFSLNFMISIAYAITTDLRAGFNIDVIGASFGGQKAGTYINGNGPGGAYTSPVQASPTGFNLLLTGPNDIGSLNSEFYLAYSLDERWSLRGGVQHIFMEYTTTTHPQQYPEPNNRFRITPTIVCIGVIYTIR